MDIEQARTFLAITAHGSFLGAARQLHLTQSTVSARIQRLEEEMGTRLFVRNRSGASQPHTVGTALSGTRDWCWSAADPTMSTRVMTISIVHPAYMVYPREAASTVLEQALQGLRELARQQ